MIDPGHGGDNHGVVGPSDWPESRLVLDLALQLKEALQSELGVQVFLTREQDQNPSLLDRTALANGLSADVFISLHAGGATSAERTGHCVYIHSHKLQAGGGESGLRGPEHPLEWEAAQSYHIDLSRRLAQELDRALSEVLRVKSQGVQRLPLAILSGANQPAVLLEVGMLTNPEESRRLRTQGYRDALTEAIIRGFKAWLEYLKRLEGE